MSNFYRGNYVVSGEQVHRVINTNDLIAERMQSIVAEQKREQREELLRQKREEFEARRAAGEENLDEKELEFTEGLFAQELILEPEPEPEIDYVAQAQAEAEQILIDAEAKATMMHDEAFKQAELAKKLAHDEGFEQGYNEGKARLEEEAAAERERIAQLEQTLLMEQQERLAQMEPQLLDTMLSVFDDVFRMQFSGKRELLLQLVMNAMRGIRETRQYKIRVSEEEVAFLREQKAVLQEKVGDDVQIEIVMDPGLKESQCIIDADSGVYDCSLDVELDNLIRTIKSLCR